METTMKSGLVNTNTQSNSNVKISANAYSSFWEQVEFTRFGIIPILLVIIGCMGGIAAAFGAGADTLKLGLIAFPTIIALALTLAVAPMRWIIWTSAIAVLLDIIVLIF